MRSNGNFLLWVLIFKFLSSIIAPFVDFCSVSAQVFGKYFYLISAPILVFEKGSLEDCYLNISQPTPRSELTFVRGAFKVVIFFTVALDNENFKCFIRASLMGIIALNLILCVLLNQLWEIQILFVLTMDTFVIMRGF